jgi:hypothetical protein
MDIEINKRRGTVTARARAAKNKTSPRGTGKGEAHAMRATDKNIIISLTNNGLRRYITDSADLSEQLAGA